MKILSDLLTLLTYTKENKAMSSVNPHKNEEFTATSENTIKTKEMPILIEVYIPLSCTVTNM